MTNNDTPKQNNPLSGPFKLNEQQKPIYDRLFRLVGPGAAAFYKDACRHMVVQPPFEATTHIVGHLLREVESSLRDVLRTFTGSTDKPKGDGAHEQDIQAILKALEYDDSDPVAKTWLSFTKDNSLHSHAHRHNLDSARIINKEFLEFWSQMGSIIDDVLDKFESKYTKVFDTLDALAKKDDPTSDDAKTIHLHIPNNLVAHQRFFSQLENPKWLSLLKKEGIFSDPPQAEHNQEEGTIRHLPWPAALYLEKVASQESDLVTDILKEVKDTDNSNVKSGLLKIALQLPKEKRIDLKEKLKDWLKSDHNFFQLTLVDPGSNLMIKFIEEHEEDAAFEIAKIFLEILPDPKPAVESHGYLPSRDPQTRLEHWHYNEFLKKEFRELVKINLGRSFEFICDLLADYLRLKHEGRKENQDKYNDYSYISRPAIEDHEQNHDRDDIQNSLITAARDIGLALIKNNPSILSSLVSILENRKWDIFRRLAIYFLSEFPYSAKELVAQYLTDESLFDKSEFQHEQAQLMNKGFNLLTKEEQQTILAWIEKAEKIAELVDKRKQETTITEDQEKAFREAWQRDQLSYIKNDLPDDWKNRYDGFVKQYGSPEHPDFSSYMTTGWVGPTSDINSQELIKMKDEELIEVLKSWEPKEEKHGFGPTKEGFGRELSAAIKLNPDRFNSISEKFKGLDPTYVRAYIQAFYELIQNGHELDWPKMLTLCSWVVEQKKEIPGRKGEIMDQDPDWGWTRKAIVSLMSRGTNSNTIPCNLREEVWKIIEPITHDVDPTPEDDLKWAENSDDAYTHAINCTRSEAINATIEYALWVYRCKEKESVGDKNLKINFTDMPEAQSVLDEHLDPESDPSVAVRAVYGRFFPWLLLIDRDWTLENLNKILPLGQFDNELYAAAWNTMMLYVPVYNDPFEILRERYLEAIKNIGKVDQKRRRYTDRDERLAEHLMLQYGRGKIELSDSLLNDFWKYADDKIRGHALDFIGRSLRSENQGLDKEILERFKALWNNRLSVIKSATDTGNYEEEASAFGWWFASGRFDDQWSFEQYLQALEIGRKQQSDYFVLERLTELVKTSPTKTVQILSKISLADQPGWAVMGHRDEINNILSSALQSQEETAHSEAKELINRLIARGYTEFSNLLSPKETVPTEKN
ncbi:MAG: hypothetical protein PHU56_01580 [Candidatus Pacebacteria bacterium]|nr:hypothetical protein [Candidatus Paceibacterota bacterium]